MNERYLRRRIIKSGLTAVIGSCLFTETTHGLYTGDEMIRPKILGLNFSPVQCDYLGLGNVFDAYRNILDLNPDALRLATYPTRPVEETHRLLQEAKDRNIKVILAVGGIKYPRWPEFFSDQELQTYLNTTAPSVIGEDKLVYEKVTSQLQQNLEEFNIYPNITHLQAGNESANQVEVAGKVTESPQLLKKELEIIAVQKKPGQKTLTTFAFPLGQMPFMPDNPKRILTEHMELVDSVGIHFYSKVPHRFLGYLTAGETDYKRAEDWRVTAEHEAKEVWATEVQAEPFESNNAVHIKNRTYPSSNPERMISLVGELTQRGYNRQLLWGSEHWIWHANQGHNEWIDAWRELQNAHLSPI